MTRDRHHWRDRIPVHPADTQVALLHGHYLRLIDSLETLSAEFRRGGMRRAAQRLDIIIREAREA